MPGNVYHQHKSFVEEGKGGETDSLKLNKNKQTPAGSTSTSESAAEVQGQSGHTQAVTGMFIEIANTVMATCGLDGWVIFWDFGTKDALHRVRVQPHTPSQIYPLTYPLIHSLGYLVTRPYTHPLIHPLIHLLIPH